MFHGEIRQCIWIVGRILRGARVGVFRDLFRKGEIHAEGIALIEKARSRLPEVRVEEVDVTANPEVAVKYRATATPALMSLAGRANWWAPKPLRRFHLRWGLWENEPVALPELKRAGYAGGLSAGLLAAGGGNAHRALARISGKARCR